MSIARLEDHAKKLAAQAQQSAELAVAHPTDPWAQIIAKNQRQAAEDAHHDLVIKRLQDAGQVVDFRFIGARADGSIPLDYFIKIFEPLSRAFKSTAHRLLTGTDQGKVAPIVSDHLNLKLAGITYGSTRVLVSGSVAPDLTGSSLLENTLHASFRLLKSSNEDLYDAIDAVGGRAATIFHEALGAIASCGFGAEFSWDSPSSGREVWHGTPDEVIRLRTLLDGAQEPTVYEETLSGYVSKLFESGKIELRIGEDRIPISYPINLIDRVQQLSISSPAKLQVLTSQYYDNVKKKDVFKRNLIEVLL